MTEPYDVTTRADREKGLQRYVDRTGREWTEPIGEKSDRKTLSPRSDACLRSAAPDLLAACIMMLDVVEHGTEEEQILRAAIARAKGIHP